MIWFFSTQPRTNKQTNKQSDHHTQLSYKNTRKENQQGNSGERESQRNIKGFTTCSSNGSGLKSGGLESSKRDLRRMSHVGPHGCRSFAAASAHTAECAGLNSEIKDTNYCHLHNFQEIHYLTTQMILSLLQEILRINRVCKGEEPPTGNNEEGKHKISTQTLLQNRKAFEATSRPQQDFCSLGLRKIKKEDLHATLPKNLAQLPSVDMQKQSGSFCCYSNLSPRLIQPSFDAQSPCILHSDCAKTSTYAKIWSLDDSLAGACAGACCMSTTAGIRMGAQGISNTPPVVKISVGDFEVKEELKSRLKYPQLESPLASSKGGLDSRQGTIGPDNKQDRTSDRNREQGTGTGDRSRTGDRNRTGEVRQTGTGMGTWIGTGNWDRVEVVCDEGEEEVTPSSNQPITINTIPSGELSQCVGAWAYNLQMDVDHRTQTSSVRASNPTLIHVVFHFIRPILSSSLSSILISSTSWSSLADLDMPDISGFFIQCVLVSFLQSQKLLVSTAFCCLSSPSPSSPISIFKYFASDTSFRQHLISIPRVQSQRMSAVVAVRIGLSVTVSLLIGDSDATALTPIYPQRSTATPQTSLL
ncbi:hypothetical protein VP01_1331g1 [Puccinia sorghi]|uniref:Uncharacterized protein n=1 Tax=Puccinia sorghi TaxID=27349 RepID=A0A0L6VME8_9BASI|nr:hypothetical protein VP01_1331g1 [Puccinia sorghi]